MLLKTHLAVVVFVILLLAGFVEGVFLFVIATLVFSLIFGINFSESKIGEKGLFKPFKFFVKNKEFFRSYGFLIFGSIILIFLIPKLALPFFLSFSLYLFVESFGREGIFPFYPLKKRWSGRVKEGGKVEISVFFFFIILNLLVLLVKLF